MKFLLSNSLLKEAILIIFGAMFSAFGIVCFLVPNDMVTGGTSGLSLVFHHAAGFFSIGVWMAIINLPLLMVAMRYFGKRYVTKSIITILLIAGCTDILSEFLQVGAVTSQSVLVAVFGGAMIGVGIGLIIRAKSSGGGTVIVASLVSLKTNFKTSEIILFFDAIIITLSFFVLPDIDRILWSVIGIYVSSKVLDVMLSGRVTKKLVHIATSKPKRVSEEIVKKFALYGTLLHGENIKMQKDSKIILVVIDATKIQTLEELVHKYDENAFLIITDAAKLYGRDN